MKRVIVRAYADSVTTIIMDVTEEEFAFLNRLEKELDDADPGYGGTITVEEANETQEEIK